MKHSRLFFITATLCLSFLQFNTTTHAAPTIHLFASFYPIYVSTLNIIQGIKDIELSNLTEPTTGCLHDYSLKPQELAKLSKADALIVNGAGMENFISKVIQSLKKLKIIDSSKGITLIDNNAHMWVSPSLAARQVETIGQELAARYPQHAAALLANTQAYVLKLKALTQEMHQALDSIPQEHKNIITFHEAFPYFASEFKLNTVAIIEREPGSEPSAGEIADTIKKVRTKKVHALFSEPQYPEKAAHLVSKETKVPFYTLDPAVTGPATTDAYLQIMRQNLKTLVRALK